MDETTDISTAQQFFFPLYVLSDKVHVKIIDTKIIDSIGATAPNLFKILIWVVQENSLSKPNHVGFGCDGAAAMIGRKNSLSVDVQR